MFSIVPLSIAVFAPISTLFPITTEPIEGILNITCSTLFSLISPSLRACSMLFGFSVTKLKPSAPKETPWCKITLFPTLTLSPMFTPGWKKHSAPITAPFPMYPFAKIFVLSPI